MTPTIAFIILGTCILIVPIVMIFIPAPTTPIVFRVECAWCKKVFVEGTVGAEVSHTICSNCEHDFCLEDRATQGIGPCLCLEPECILQH